MKNNRKQKGEAGVFGLLITTTLVFFAVLGLLVLSVAKLPQIQAAAAEAALGAGNASLARWVAGTMENADTAQEYIRACDYLDGMQAMEKGDWEWAKNCFTAAGNHKDAKTQVKACQYGMAESFFAQGNYEEAARAFWALDGYRDSADRYACCRYEQALVLEQQGAAGQAVVIYSELGDYRDANSRAEKLAMEITGIADGAQAVASLAGLSVEDVARMAQLEEARMALPKHILVLGFCHTVALKADGTVLACGQNEYGQCDVSRWQGITAICAGAYHTLGLRKDGTVVAAGSDGQGQCRVTEWTDVVAIAATDYASYGLQKDGTLLCAGEYAQTEVLEWTEVATIVAGSYNLAALGRDGRVRIYPQPAGLEAMTGVVDLALNTAYAAGLRADGTVVTTDQRQLGWENILQLSAGSTCILGLDDSGKVFAHFFRQADALDFSQVQDAVAVCAAATHCAVVCRDGSVRVFGSNLYGEANTADWNLFP